MALTKMWELFSWGEKMRWQPEQFEMAMKLYDKGLTSSEIADKLTNQYHQPISDAAVRRQFNRRHISLRHRRWNDDGVQTSTTILKVVKGQHMSPDDVMRAHGYNPEQWQLTNNISNFWKQSEQVTSYQSKISVKPRHDVSAKEFANIFNEQIKPIKVKPELTGKHNLVIPLFDLHFGIMTFDSMKKHLLEIKEIIKRGYKHIVIEQGGDLVHSDFINKTMTVKGTQLDHVNMVQALKDAKRFYDEVILCALKYAEHVSVYSVGGNHDFDLSYMFVDALADRYPQVDVHNTSAYRQCYQIDQVSILLAHGDKAQKNLPMLFATEHPLEWSQSAYREIHYGHYHKEVTNDDYGVVTRQFGTPKLNDPYEKENGYTMAHHKLQLLEFSSNELRALYNV